MRGLNSLVVVVVIDDGEVEGAGRGRGRGGDCWTTFTIRAGFRMVGGCEGGGGGGGNWIDCDDAGKGNDDGDCWDDKSFHERLKFTHKRWEYV